MNPDIKMQDYYINFISNIKNDIIKYNKEIKYYESVKTKQIDFFNNNKNTFDKILGVNYDDNKALQIANNLIKIEVNTTNKFYIGQIIKYYYTLDKINEYTKMIDIANKRKSIKYRQFENYVVKYYNMVHKFVLQGFGYKFNSGVGTLCINRWRLRENGKPCIDYAETNKRKNELLAQGKKLYDKNEALWYKTRNIPYDGIDYRVFKKETHYYEIAFIKSKIFGNNNYIFKHSEYINIKYRGKSFKELADEYCNSIDDIANFQCDLKYKLNMCLYKYPEYYINYIRNDEEDKYKYGAHNS